jgi:glyoxylase-like metal-dependent hydrolase (beta-lactamase superfamily II)
MPQEEHVVRFETDAGRRIYRIRCDTHRPLAGYAYLVIGEGDRCQSSVSSPQSTVHSERMQHSQILQILPDDWRPMTAASTLIDCGTGENGSDRELLRGLELVKETYHEDFHITDIGRLIITHAHVDHAGFGKRLLELTGAEAWCHQYDASVLERYDECAAIANRRFDDFLRSAGIETNRREIIENFGFVRGRCQPFPVKRRLHDGDHFDGITVIHTAGHSPGHICLLIDKSHLILGDHILSNTLPQIWSEQVTPQTGYIRYCDSLKKIEETAANAIGLPGHEHIIEDIPKRLRSIRHSHERRMERLLDILRNSPEPMTISQIARKMYLTQANGKGTLLALTDIGARIEYLAINGFVSVANFEESEMNKTEKILFKV